MKLGTSNCANYSTRNPGHSAKYVYHTGTSASSIARAGTSCATERRRTINLSSTPWTLLSIPNYYIKKGRPHGHRYGKKPGDREHYIANSLKKKCKKKYYWVSTTDSYETRNSARTRLTTVEPKKFVAKWMTLRTKTTPTI